MNNFYRILSLLVYPFCMFSCFFFVLRKKKYRDALKDNWKSILINTFGLFFIVALGIFVFFQFEDTIYAYDYAGHWIRALTLKKYFWENPSQIFSVVYESMNYSDYSYFPALLNLPCILINESYGFYCLSNLTLFLFPTVLLLNILYFTYIDKSKWIPLITSIAVFPLYLTLFYGKVDCCGLFFIAVAYSLVILIDLDEIKLSDNLFVNLCSFVAIFLRRWYLYSVVCLYLSYFIKWLFSKRKLKHFLFIISSGILLLAIVLIFFQPFLLNVLHNNFSEAYAVYNNPGKLLSFINNLSPLVLLICLIGSIFLFGKDKKFLLINVISIVLPCILVWRIQSFEYHHYYIFLLNIVILFTIGIAELQEYRKKAGILLSVLLLVQPLVIFSEFGNTLPIFTNIRKTPEVLSDKEKIIDLASYLRSIETDENMTSYLAGGSYGILTDDLLRNALLPSLNSPLIESAVLDLRDGFPKDFECIRYILVMDPMIYTDQNYQHMFDIIAYAVTLHPDISKIYNPIYETEINNIKVTVYEKTGEMTKDMKQYFYDEMLKYYPGYEEYFSYILN